MEAFPYLSPKDDYSLFNILCKQSSVEQNSPFLVYKNPVPSLDLPPLDNINSHGIPTSNAFLFQRLYDSTHFPVSLLRLRDVRLSNQYLQNSSCDVNHMPPPLSDQATVEEGKKRKHFEKIKLTSRLPIYDISNNIDLEAGMNGYVSVKRSKVGDPKKTEKVASSEPPKDFIHVRARRGQATDSHSLAERVRREKINERMRILRELVPGCTKTTGKALMLEEIINYVKSLQSQVELLSMKVASVSAYYDISVELGKELSREIKEDKGIPESISHSSENSIQAQQASHVLGVSTSYDNIMQEKPWRSLGEIKLEAMGANEWDNEMQYLLDGGVHI